MWNQIVKEIILNILLFLPWKVILRFRFVCRAWNNIFENDYFLRTVFTRDYPKSNIFCGKEIAGLNIRQYLKMKTSKLVHQMTSYAPFSKRYRHTSTLFEDVIYIIGGDNEDIITEDFIIKFYPKTLKYEKVFVMFKPQQISKHTSVLKDHTIYIYGGLVGYIPSKSFYYYDILENTWGTMNQTEVSPPTLFNHQALLFNENMWIFFGNNDINNNYSDQIWTYDFSNFYILTLDERNWELLDTTGDKPPPSCGSYIVEHKRNIFMIGGGYSNCPRLHKSKESKIYILDPESLIWKSIAMNEYPQCSRFLTGIAFEDFIYVFGGSNCSKTNAFSVWRLDLVQLKWRRENLKIFGDSFTAIQLDNIIYLIFGFFIFPKNNIELFSF